VNQFRNSETGPSHKFWWGLFAFTFVALGFALSVGFPETWGLFRRSAEVSGVVIDKDPKNHASVTYSYNVNSRQYVDSSNTGDENPPFESLKTGDAVRVYYDREHPSISTLKDPQSLFTSSVLQWLITVLTCSAVPTLVIRFTVLTEYARKNRRIDSDRAVTQE
jgi:Protein of unknown function (DUF3592)